MNKIFLLTLKRNLLNIPMSLSIIIFTLLLIGILGNVIKEMQEKGVTLVEEVAYYNTLEGEERIQLDQIILDKQFKELYQIQMINTKEEGIRGVESGKYNTFIAVEKMEDKNNILLHTSNTNTPLRSILLTYTQTANFIYNIYNMGGTLEAENNQAQVLNQLDNGKGRPIGFDYYCVQTLFQSLILGGIFGVYSILEDYEKNTYIRLKSAPISKNCVLIARILANTIYLMLLSITIIFFTVILYDANWKGNIGVITLAILLQSLAVNGIGMLAAKLTRSTGLSVGIVLLALMLWSKPSGAYGPEPSASPLALLSPNVNVKNAIYGAIYGGSMHMILTALIALILINVVIYTFIFLPERRRTNAYL